MPHFVLRDIGQQTPVSFGTGKGGTQRWGRLPGQTKSSVVVAIHAGTDPQRQVDCPAGETGDPFQKVIVGGVGHHMGDVPLTFRVKTHRSQQSVLIDGIARRPNHFANK